LFTKNSTEKEYIGTICVNGQGLCVSGSGLGVEYSPEYGL